MNQGRTLVIGDIHGCVDEVERLLDAMAPGTGDTVCFLGDYVDRGPSPKAVIERLIRLRSEGPKCVFLKGNHEDMFLDYIGYEGRHGEAFLWNGGDSTLESYGIEGLRGGSAAERLPGAHRDFLLALESRASLGPLLCVHAGVRPTLPLDEQRDEDLLWIREEFILAEHPFPYTVVYGHTPQRDILVHLPFKLGLDTGLVYGNLLSCFELRDKELIQIERRGSQVRRRSLAAQFENARVGAA